MEQVDVKHTPYQKNSKFHLSCIACWVCEPEQVTQPLVPQFPHLQNKDNNNTQLRE